MGYVLGGQIAHWDEAHESWRWAFFVVVLPGLILGLLSFLMREPKVGGADAISKPARRITWRDLRILWETPSFVLDTLGMTAMTFAMGALAWWMPDYLKSHDVPPLWGLDPRSVFGLITALAGLAGTVAGGSAATVCGGAFRVPISSFPGSACCSVRRRCCCSWSVPFPMAWVCIFLCVFFMFFNTGPTNIDPGQWSTTVLRPTAFAVNIFVIHIFGDAVSPPLIGAGADRWDMAHGFAVVSAFLAIGGLFWLWGGRYLRARYRNVRRGWRSSPLHEGTPAPPCRRTRNLARDIVRAGRPPTEWQALLGLRRRLSTCCQCVTVAFGAGR